MNTDLKKMGKSGFCRTQTNCPNDEIYEHEVVTPISHCNGESDCHFLTPSKRVGPKIQQKIKNLEGSYTSILANDEVMEFGNASSVTNKYQELKHLERENSFESVQKKWEEIAGRYKTSKNVRTKRNMFDKSVCRCWMSQTVCSSSEDGMMQEDPRSSSSGNIITIKEACYNEDIGGSLLHLSQSRSTTELNTTGVNTEQPQFKSIGINTFFEEGEERTDLSLQKFTSPKLKLSGGRKSLSRIPRPVQHRSKLTTSKHLMNLGSKGIPEVKGEENTDMKRYHQDQDCYASHKDNEKTEVQIFVREPMRSAALQYPSDDFQMALETINAALLHGQTSKTIPSCMNVILTEWLSVAGVRCANPENVAVYLECFKKLSPKLLRYVINLPDKSGLIALHYACSNENFGVILKLLETNVCDPNKVNKAGYNCIMLASLAHLQTPSEEDVLRKLFSLGNVNIKAAQHGQTALMLASAHGRFECAKLLVEAGANLNIQDEDGSTALMYACEHGHVDIVQLLLAQYECDPDIKDNDGFSALNVAMDAGFKDIAVLLYAHMHFMTRPESPSLLSPGGHSILAKRSVSMIVRSRNSDSLDRNSKENTFVLGGTAKRQQSSIN